MNPRNQANNLALLSSAVGRWHGAVSNANNNLSPRLPVALAPVQVSIPASISVNPPAIADDNLLGVAELFDTPEEKVLKKIRQQLGKDKGNWRTGLHGLVESELDIILDPDSHEQEIVLEAINNIFSGNLENFTNKKDLAKDLIIIQELLILQLESSIYKSLIQRDVKQGKMLPSLEFVKLETLEILENRMSLGIFSHIKHKIVTEDKPFFIPNKKYHYDEFFECLKKLVIPFDIKMLPLSQINIFEHALLQWAKIKEFPLRCERTHHNIVDHHIIFSEGYFHLHLSLSQPSIRKFMHFLDRHLGEDSAEIVASSYLGKTSIRLTISNVIKNIFSGDFHDFIISMLENKDIVYNYQLLSRRKNVLYETVVERFRTAVGGKYQVSKFSDFAETCLLHAFGVNEELKTAEYRRTNRYDSFISCTDFYLGISLEGANKLVREMNIQFPEAAKLERAHASLLHKGDVELQVVSIKNEVLVQNDFLDKLALSLDYIAEHNPDLLEIFQIAAPGTSKHTTKFLAGELIKLSEEFKNEENLSTSLKTLSLFSSERKPKSDIQKASFELTKAISAYESQCVTQEEHRFFKQGKKKDIKTIQRELNIQQSLSSFIKRQP